MSSTSSEPSNLSGQSGEPVNIRQELKAIEEAELAPTKEPGKSGRKIALRTNYYRMVVAPNKVIHHFDVTIKETNATVGKESVKFRDEKMKFFMAFLEEKMPIAKEQIAYDGQSNAYWFSDKLAGGSDGKDGQEAKRFSFDYAPRGTRKRAFEVLLRKVNTFNSNDINSYLAGHTLTLKNEQIQAYDVILRHQASTKMICHGRNFFDPASAGKKDLGSGREVLTGYFQACKTITTRSGGSLALNIDVANAAFLKQILVTDFANEVLKPRGGLQDIGGRNWWTDSMRKRFESDCKGVQFYGTHLKGGDQKTWRCNSLSRNGAVQQQFTFQDANGRSVTTTVADYYKKTYNITLRFPNMPLIVNGTPKNPERVKYFPAELMKIAPRQAHKGKLDEMMTSNMIRQVATPAPVRQRDTDSMAKRAVANSSEKAAQYGMKLNSQMEQIEGRVLEAPQMVYKAKGRDTTVAPRQGSWDTRDCGFFKGMELKSWVILNNGARLDDRQLQQFADGLCKSGHFNGMKISQPAKIMHIRGQNELDLKLKQCKANNIALALIIMPRRSTAEYSFIKTTSEVGYGVMTQCIQAKNVERANGQLFGNLLQKINTKLGGVNTVIAKASKPAIFTKPIMVVGLSIAHGSPGSNTPSVVSATFSCDGAVYRYIHAVRVQERGVGLITKLKEMMVEGCKGFYGQTKVKPVKVIVYRFGGSDGELTKIAGYEVKQCKEAFASLPQFNPGLTFICVNKMHRTRLFCENANDRVGKSQNVPAGTVVDQGLTAKDKFDFYLNSAQGIQGTSRPTHYTLIYDDNGLSADALQIMTYALCHGYARCTRSVSIPVPVYYAELNRERAMRYLHEALGGSDAGSVMSGRGDAVPSMADLQKRITTQATLPKMNYV